MKSRIVVECPIHGDFEVIASNHVRVFQRSDKKHLKPTGCPHCGKELVRTRNLAGAKTTEQFVKEADTVHNVRYRYDKTHYINNYTGVIITCNVHGDFEQLPTDHLRGTGCPRCKNSKGETIIAKALTRIGVVYYQEYKTPDCVSSSGYELKFDFYIPAYKLFIEFDGEQHFKPVQFHKQMSIEVAMENLTKTQKFDQIKNDYVKAIGERLLRIRYDEKDIAHAMVNRTIEEQSQIL